MYFKKFLIILIVFLLVGCSSSNVSPNKSNNTSSEKQEEVDQNNSEVTEPDDVVVTDTTENDEPISSPDENHSNDTKLNSIALLNYLTVVAEQIHQSPDGKMYLEEKYNALINNLYPNAVDTETQSHVTDLLRSIESLRMISVKRDRLAYIYEQNKAAAVLNRIPSSEDILNFVVSKKTIKSIVSLVHTTINTAKSYQEELNNIEMEYLKDGWELDDSMSQEISEQRLNAWNYMQNIVRDNDLDGDLALNETAVNDLVSWEKTDNITRRISLLEENEQKYKAYGGYWILLAESYYEDENYAKCIEATDKYISTQPRIFRTDVSLANLLPCSITSLLETREGTNLLDKEKLYVETLVKNCSTGDWELRYFAGITYLDLYNQTNNEEYLLNAYKLFRTNVNELVDKQIEANASYLADVKEIEASKSASKEQKEEIKQYNKMLKEVRKTELPPVNNALLFNAVSFLSLAERMDYSEDSKTVVDKLLHINGKNPLFLTSTVDRNAWSSIKDKETITASFDGKKIEIPAVFVCDGSVLSLKIINTLGSKVVEDWNISKVDRKKGGINEFIATYTSKDIKDAEYHDGDKVVLTVRPFENLFEEYSITFTVKEKKIAVLTTYEFIIEE